MSSTEVALLASAFLLAGCQEPTAVLGPAAPRLSPVPVLPPAPSQPTSPSTPLSPRPVWVPGHPSGNATVACSLSASPGALEVSYAVTSNAPATLWVMDRLPLWDTNGPPRTLSTDPPFAVMEDANLHVWQGPAPVPADREIMARHMPLGTRLPRGRTVTHSVRLALPLAEQTQYGPPTDRSTMPVTVRALRLTVTLLSEDARGFDARATPFGADIRTVRSPQMILDVETVSCTVALPAPLPGVRFRAAHGGPLGR